MAVFKHAYKGYDGPLTPARSRFLVLPRYAFEEMSRKRFYSMFFLVSMLAPLIFALIIYVEHNLSVVADLCDRITVLTRGQVLAEGDYRTVSADPAVREAYLGTGDV